MKRRNSYWIMLILSAAAVVIFSFQTYKRISTSAAAAGNNEDDERQILTIHLIGERHCGTKWITKHIEDCFGSQVTVLNRYTRFKHWFQYDDVTSFPTNSAIVVVMFRDPYQWVNAMQKKPYHALDHYNLSWDRFVKLEWTIERGEKDKELIDSNATNNVTCVHRFSFNEVVPCTIQDRNNWYNDTHSYTNRGLMYELNQDGSGNPYQNIVDLRRDKIKNFLSIRNYPAVAAFFPVQYEYVVSRGTADLISEIETVTGVHAECEKSPPRELPLKQLDDNYVKWMNEHVDWDVEAMIGYYKTSESAT